jgi:hypothetical protein
VPRIILIRLLHHAASRCTATVSILRQTYSIFFLAYCTLLQLQNKATHALCTLTRTTRYCTVLCGYPQAFLRGWSDIRSAALLLLGPSLLSLSQVRYRRRREGRGVVGGVVSPGGAAEDGKCCRVGRAHTSRQSFPTALSSELSSLKFPSLPFARIHSSSSTRLVS